MDRLHRVFLVLCLSSSLVLSLVASVVADRSFYFPAVIIEAEVFPDGSMRVEEHRTVSFQGSFSGLFQWIPVAEPMEIVDIKVREGNIAYEFNPGQEYGPPGTFLMRRENEQVLVDWSFTAQDEARTFTLEYRIVNVVEVHRDVAELYYQFIGDETDVKTEKATVRLLLPPGVRKEDIRAWGFGPVAGVVTIESPREVVWRAAPLPSRTFLEGRVVFPVELVPDAAVHTGREALPGILKEEAARAAQANRRIWLGRVDLVLSVLILLAAILLITFIWRRHKKAVTFTGKYYRELPANYSPAELGVLWRQGQPTIPDFTATILHLAQRGYLVIEEYTEKKGMLRKREQKGYRLQRQDPEQDDLKEHEKALLKFIFQDVAAAIKKNEEGITFQEIEAYAKKNRNRFTTFWSRWQKDLKKAGEMQGFFDKKAQKTKAILSVAAFVLIVSGALLVFLGARFIFTGITVLLVGPFFLFASILMSKRSRQGEEDYVRWRAFSRFLSHFSQIKTKEIPSLVLWEHYLIYAVTLGVAREVIKQLGQLYPQMQDERHVLGTGWLVWSGQSTDMQSLSTGLSNMTNTINQSFAHAFATQASGSGTGGGFSAGGGGGAGGGGVGAR